MVYKKVVSKNFKGKLFTKLFTKRFLVVKIVLKLKCKRFIKSNKNTIIFSL